MHIRFNRVDFLLSAASAKQFPTDLMPEIAIIGRSNVGKSSVLNALVERRAMAKVSKSPGRTQLINYFNIDDKFYLVDLPGYGFAKVPDNVRRRWDQLIGAYLKTRETLAGAFLLLDIRRQPSRDDIAMWEWLTEMQIPVLIMLTKADKLSKTAALNQRRVICKMLDIEMSAPILTSALKKMGFDDVKKAIEALLFADEAYTTHDN